MVALRHVVVVGRQRDLQSCPQLTAAATTDPEYDGFKYADLPVKREMRGPTVEYSTR